MTKGAARTATIVVLVACVAFHLAFLLVQMCLCQPVSSPSIASKAATVLTGCKQIAKQWDPKIVGGKCLPAVHVYTSMSSLTICFDVAV
jgi:hypothetical protein